MSEQARKDAIGEGAGGKEGWGGGQRRAGVSGGRVTN